ncbi:SCP2 sterol-binding domain-containing protein [uncultured Jatrophihabitans sp.]|uniref:SCP2 sterol-binding domain-containing protein n=1 Tax=uncultured Jatrophihabitans sp. TaxID=1610747 RepID=UPI0035C991FD
MASFTGPEDLRRYVGGIFEQALADDDLGPRLAATGVTLKVVTTEPDAALLLDLPNKHVALGSPDDPVDATMRMTSETANRFWLGQVNLPVAMARRQVGVEGRIGALLKLVPSTKTLFPAYRALLEADGRADLLQG